MMLDVIAGHVKLGDDVTEYRQLKTGAGCKSQHPFLLYARHEHCLTGGSPEQARIAGSA